MADMLRIVSLLTFLCVASADSLFPFTSFEFKAIVHESMTGPTLEQMRSAYAGEPWVADYLKMGSHQGYQQWTVPTTGDYRIRADGAQGGGFPTVAGCQTLDGYGPAGARIEGTFSLTKGDVLTFIIGSSGATPTTDKRSYTDHNTYPHAGGGGGTFVALNDGLLLAAGGGGGRAAQITYCQHSVGFADTEEDGKGRAFESGGDITIPQFSNKKVHGGDSGNGGNSQNQCVIATGHSDSNCGSAGGGWTSSGQNGEHWMATPIGGGTYNNGFKGGDQGGYPQRNLGFGGFGGGGGGQIGGPGGGGGYSGGAVCSRYCTFTATGGGGGSYNRGADQVNTAGGATRTTNSMVLADGSVFVELVAVPTTTTATTSTASATETETTSTSATDTETSSTATTSITSATETTTSTAMLFVDAALFSRVANLAFLSSCAAAMLASL